MQLTRDHKPGMPSEYTRIVVRAAWETGKASRMDTEGHERGNRLEKPLATSHIHKSARTPKSSIGVAMLQRRHVAMREVGSSQHAWTLRVVLFHSSH